MNINMDIVKTSGFDDPAPIHDFYRLWFNLIDLCDKKWYSVADHHGNHYWKSKMLFFTMRHFMINVWALIATNQYKKWISFRADLADDLTAFDD
jgi:hypothetical protein